MTLQKAGQPDVTITADIPAAGQLVDVDATMISQALTNLIKNAGEATETYVEKKNPVDFNPRIKVAMTYDGTTAQIVISDNGIGLPTDRARLFEPYVTTRSSGTGLGLPIVKKIIEEHGGTLVLTDAADFDGAGHVGAAAVITLPLGFVSSFGYYTPAISIFIFYVLVSMEVLAEEIEDPFGRDANDLPTGDLSKKIRANVQEVLR